MPLYNLKTADGEFRITKFDNGLNVESSYVVSERECSCPAGSRPVCRHRTMLPKMLNVGAEDSGMFYDFDADQFLEPMADSEDTQPAIVSPIEDVGLERDVPLEVDGELPPQAAQDMLPPSPRLINKINTDHLTSSDPAPDIFKMLEPTPVHPALSGPLKRRI